MPGRRSEDHFALGRDENRLRRDLRALPMRTVAHPPVMWPPSVASPRCKFLADQHRWLSTHNNVIDAPLAPRLITDPSGVLLANEDGRTPGLQDRAAHMG